MLTSAVRMCAHGLRDAAEVLLLWSVKSVSRTQCERRSYHCILKGALFPKLKSQLAKKNINISSNKYKTGNAKSAFSTTLDLNESRSIELQKFLQKHSITIEGNNPSTPYFSIKDAGFPDDILSVLRKCDIQEPTPIQSLAWPHGIDGRDFVGISKTGSGKTLGFIIPALLHVNKIKRAKPNQDEPSALVLVPTRELAQQVYTVAKLFSHLSVRTVCLYGGAPRRSQMTLIQRGVDLCVATPGRILDMINSGFLSLDQCSFLVLDEADRMLDMGFLPDLEQIISTIKCNKQVLMWSATWPREVKCVAEQFLSDYIFVAIGSTELKPNANVHQVVKVVSAEEKRKILLDLLHDILQDGASAKVLVFVETKLDVDRLRYFLQKNMNEKVHAIHSGKSQMQRDAMVRDFRRGSCSVLLATAVASRGIDIDDITHIINYDCPKYYEEYIHKIGRTARHDKTGTAITLVTSSDKSSKYLIEALKESNQNIPEELYSIAEIRLLSFNSRYSKKRPNRRFEGRRHDNWF